MLHRASRRSPQPTSQFEVFPFFPTVRTGRAASTRAIRGRPTWIVGPPSLGPTRFVTRPMYSFRDAKPPNRGLRYAFASEAKIGRARAISRAATSEALRGQAVPGQGHVDRGRGPCVLRRGATTLAGTPRAHPIYIDRGWRVSCRLRNSTLGFPPPQLGLLGPFLPRTRQILKKISVRNRNMLLL